MTQAPEQAPHVVNIASVQEIEDFDGEHWGSACKPLTPALDAERGRLGVNLTRVPPGRSACPGRASRRRYARRP